MTAEELDDANRFQAWQIDALQAHPAGTELVRVGPFQVVVSDGPSPFNWVTLVDPNIEEGDLRDSVGPLRSMFEGRHEGLEVEFNEAVLPHAAAWLEAAGFALAERNPLMACRPAVFKRFAAADVTLSSLGLDSPEEELRAFQSIRWTAGSDSEREAPPVDDLRRELTSPTSVYMLAWLDREPVGTGVSHALNGAAEIVGIVTRADRRRRGVAATVSSTLVERHFKSGGDFVFLDAANDQAVRVYERLGFRRFGANLIYR
ncbi:MAG TPA: GNAT family N-acetyltransferase [Candidatus Dormibacteraeota bacterium]